MSLLIVPFLKPRSLPAASKIATKALPACRHHNSHRGREYHTERWNGRDDTGGRAAQGRRGEQRSIEDVFIRALVLAGSCQRHRPRLSNGLRHSNGPTPAGCRGASQRSRRSFSSKSTDQQNGLALGPSSPEPEFTKEEYKSLVETYHEYGGWNNKRSKKGKKMKERAPRDVEQVKEHHPLAPSLFLTAEQEQRSSPAERQVLPPEDGAHAMHLRFFYELLHSKRGHVDLNKLWAAYEALQTPRPRYLHVRDLEKFFWHLTWVEYFHQEGISDKYFTLLSECIEEGIPLTKYVWTSAVAFAGRWTRNTTSEEIKKAIESWMRMEKFGHQANLVTFSILFQTAVRAGRYGLADTIFNEVKERGLSLDRTFMINVIYYAGSRRDGDAVRQAFRELVNAGEIVDTSVMNTVILSLLRAGEFGAAENVFLRMKSLYEEKFGTEAPHDWRTKKELSKLLNQTGQDLKMERERHQASFFGAIFSTDDRREKIQKASPIAPDSRTYQILVKHCIYTSAELAKIKAYLAEMQARDVQVHGSLYTHILRGFATHGGYLSAGWDRGSLEEIWREVLDQMEPPDPAMDSAIRRTASQPESYQPFHSDDFDMLGAMMAEKNESVPEMPAQSGSAPRDNTSEKDAESFRNEAFSDIAEFEPRPYVNKGFALSAINAFYKCAGQARMLEVWRDLLLRWKHGSAEDKMYVQKVVDRLTTEG